MISEQMKKYGLFEVTGVELEYMIVDRNTLKVKPITDELFKLKLGKIASDVPNGRIGWSNELVAHVVELKTNGPVPQLSGLSQAFFDNIIEINTLLKDFNAMLLPTAAHPLMDPFRETVLWKYEYNEIYDMYNRIFDCRGHGWSNLQSTHLNLPFKGDKEFEKLHAAIRVLLPVIPALCASSPILDGKVTPYLDARLETYRHNQEKLPALGGKLIPERVFSGEEYEKYIFDPIDKALRPYDPEHIMNHYFMNSRGAIARFDRGAIEIRIIDIQECPLADLAIAALIIAVLRKLVAQSWSSLEVQKQWTEDDLLTIFLQTIHSAEKTIITNKKYLQLFGVKDKSLLASELWLHLFSEIEKELPVKYRKAVLTILQEGSLASRILRAVGPNPDEKSILRVYHKLADCLAANRIFKA